MKISTATQVKPVLVAVCAVASLSAGPRPQARPDPWEPVRFLAGTWEGTATGVGGAGTARRTYAFVLKDRYLHEKNVTTYPPQDKNAAGEVHEHWSFISYDRARSDEDQFQQCRE